jgi:DSBA-like thioredoxin domain
VTLSFAVTWDYRCPFARNAHEHVVAGLQDGADWAVEFVPFSLNQVHVAEGDVDAWDDPAQASSLLAMQAGIVVLERMPDLFLAAHLALFSARHDEGGDLRQPEVVAQALHRVGVDGSAVLAEVENGWPLSTFRKAHTHAVDSHQVWGVPTFIVGDQAAFIRFMHRPRGDAGVARRTVERAVDLLAGWPDLNEFKHTSVSR